MKFFRRRKSEEPGRLRLPLSAWLSYMLVATLLFSGVSFSKFAATAAMNDSVTVAGFNVSYSGGGDKALSLTADKLSDTYTFSVTSNSDVTVEYEIVVNTGAALPTGIVMSLKKGIEDLGDPANSGGQYVWKIAEPFGAGKNETAQFTLTFTAEDGAETTELSGINVSVNAQQRD